jgi:hypothetical protein
MENPRESTTVAMTPSGDELRVIDQLQQANALNTTSACPNVARRQMLTAFAATGIALTQVPMIAPAAAQASPELLPGLPTYFLNVVDFIQSLVQIPAAPVNFNKFKNPKTGKPLDLENTTTATQYLAGIANLYALDLFGNTVGSVGRCSASFLCFQVPSLDPRGTDPHHPRTYTDIANFISLDNGLIVSWFTPTFLADLGLDSAIRGMVTECIVVAATKIGVNPFYGETFNLKVSSVGEQVQFVFTLLKPAFAR